VDVRTSVPHLWANNPFLTPLPDRENGIEEIKCEYPAINESNRTPIHFLEAFPRFLSERLETPVNLTEFRGDVHLSEYERTSRSPLFPGEDGEHYWLISGGGKRDFTIKWWDHQRYQQVVDYFRGRIAFVQVGAAGDFHPRLNGTIDLRAKTSVRELIHLVHHAAGVVTPVSFLMHLSAAVPPSARLRVTGLESRPCVVIAGGREPVHWEAYPTHQFIHTVGALACCRTGGCWRSRTRPLGDGSEHDSPRRVCVDVVGKLPRCMDMITAEDVIRRIELYLAGVGRWTRRRQTVVNASLPARRERVTRHPSGQPLSTESAPSAIEEVIRSTPAYPAERFSERGIVIPAGGPEYLACAWVCISMLRKLKCKLPIQVWHIGEQECPQAVKELFAKLEVEFVDAIGMRRKWPTRRLGGWPLKAYAVVNCPFKEVLLLDADNVPLINPAKLFESKPYLETGAIFWPDLGRIQQEHPVWNICAVSYQDEPEVESGQLIVNKERCWRALQLALWMNEHSDFFYLHMHGDKETFHLAFRRLDQRYSMPSLPPVDIRGALLQHDFDGKVIFQHRGAAKWAPSGANYRVRGFKREKTCLRFLTQLTDEPTWQQYCGSRDVKPKTIHRASEPIEFKPGLTLRAPVNAVTGYGLHACQITHDFQALGVDLAILPTSISESSAAIPPLVKSRLITRKEVSAETELVLHPPVVTPFPGKRTAYFTMWETTHLPCQAVTLLNQADCVILPCDWNIEVFRNSGVTVPIVKVPLGINTDVFSFHSPDASGLCVFGAAARLKESDPARKRLDRVIQAFQRAFPSKNDVRLRIKIFADCEFAVPDDDRIDVTAQYLSESALATWFQTLTCFVSAAAAEGWGLMQHQALAIGRPVVTPYYGGVKEFVTPGNAYILPHREVPATGGFDGMGCWSETALEDMIETMRRIYHNRGEAEAKGVNGAKDVAPLSWRRSSEMLVSVLRRHRFLPDS
jgi:glycosyltransferase involved in cell wall biosynthesis/ADP-heptose:LPS heptosyltransferase